MTNGKQSEAILLTDLSPFERTTNGPGSAVGHNADQMQSVKNLYSAEMPPRLQSSLDTETLQVMFADSFTPV